MVVRYCGGVSPRRSADEAAVTRHQILRTAVSRASCVGLEGLTIGALAHELEMSKSGVIGPFGSRVELLSATLAAAVTTFRDAVIAPLSECEPGRQRLERLIDVWVDYLVDSPFTGGCFVTSASAELDDRPGALRDRLVEVVRSWRGYLAVEIAAAQPDRPEEQIAELVTTLVGISMAMNQDLRLLDDPGAAMRGRQAMRRAVDLPIL